MIYVNYVYSFMKQQIHWYLYLLTETKLSAERETIKRYQTKQKTGLIETQNLHTVTYILLTILVLV